MADPRHCRATAEDSNKAGKTSSRHCSDIEGSSIKLNGL